jgi:isopentenyl-diphosphate delta-isomerase
MEVKKRQEIILVDGEDKPVGSASKLEAHQEGGTLHRAFSVFIFDHSGRMLLQRRARTKYHFGGLWSNACCGHPRPGEDTADAARRRLREEFGFETEIDDLFRFTYRATDEASGLTEHEFDHVFHGEFDGEPLPDPDEIEGWRWVDADALRADLVANPERYTPWFRASAERVLELVPSKT